MTIQLNDTAFSFHCQGDVSPKGRSRTSHLPSEYEEKSKPNNRTNSL
ncbi:MAG: hypothetical protein LBC20_16855 [Planctomycetaceae bacterium]|nr:hypothetical protein [Planctomycetaceae bacterium]